MRANIFGPITYVGRYREGLIFGDIPMPQSIWDWTCNNPWPAIGNNDAEQRAWDKSETAVLTMDRTPQIAVSETEVPILWEAFDAIPNRRFGDAVTEFIAYRAGEL